jgi:hypothetical protein
MEWDCVQYLQEQEKNGINDLVSTIFIRIDFLLITIYQKSIFPNFISEHVKKLGDSLKCMLEMSG